MIRGRHERRNRSLGAREQTDVAHPRVRRRRHERFHVQIRVRQNVHRVFVAAALGLTCLPTIGQAQESSLAAHAVTPLLGSTPAPALSTVNDIVSAEPIEAQYPSISPVSETLPSPRIGVLLPLYASFAGLQALDAHSTMRALENGGTERNPLLGDLAGQPAALFALKAGVTASTILLTERLRPKHRVAAIALMAALDSFYAMVVVHNYRVAR
jgi:hypothetical protein